MIISEMISVKWLLVTQNPKKNSSEIWIFRINTIDLIAVLPKFKLNSIYSRVHKIIEFIDFHCKFINNFNAIQTLKMLTLLQCIQKYKPKYLYDKWKSLCWFYSCICIYYLKTWFASFTEQQLTWHKAPIFSYASNVPIIYLKVIFWPGFDKKSC